MSYTLYNKMYRSPTDLISSLESKGLKVNDIHKALSFINQINYYRFKIYLLPFFDQINNVYLADASFEDGVSLYRFDDALRNLLFSVIGRIEVKLRTRLDQVITADNHSPFWYLDDSFFISHKLGQINRFRSQLAASFQQSRDDFSTHFKANYFNDTNPNFKQLPPFWVLTELSTFGNIRAIYQSIEIKRFKGANNTNKLNSLAQEFGAKNLSELNNWIDLIRDVRNRCAHHSRVWNCNYREPRQISSLLSPLYQPSRRNRLYLFVALLHKIDNALHLDINMKASLLVLLNKYPAAQNKIHSAGFPLHWEDDLFWQSK